MARGNQAYLDHLKKVALFSACNTKELQRIARSGTEIKVPEGYKLTDQGQLGNQAFVLMDGTVTVKRNGKKVAQLGPGTMVGELSLLDHGPRTATVTTDGGRHGVRHRPAQLHGGARRRAGAVAQAARPHWPGASATSTASTTGRSSGSLGRASRS